MATVAIDNGELVVRMTGLHKLWAMKSELRIPLAQVRGATHDPGIVHESKGIRGPGTHVPRFLTAGTFRHDGSRVFWDVSNAEKAVVIELAHAEYDRLVVEVDDPIAVVDTIELNKPQGTS